MATVFVAKRFGRKQVTVTYSWMTLMIIEIAKPTWIDVSPVDSVEQIVREAKRMIYAACELSGSNASTAIREVRYKPNFNAWPVDVDMAKATYLWSSVDIVMDDCKISIDDACRFADILRESMWPGVVITLRDNDGFTKLSLKRPGQE